MSRLSTGPTCFSVAERLGLGVRLRDSEELPLRDVLFCTFIHSRIRRAFTERSVSGAALGARDTVSTHLPGAWGLVGKRTM